MIKDKSGIKDQLQEDFQDPILGYSNLGHF